MSASIRVFLPFAPFVRHSSTFSSFLDTHRAVALTGQPNYRIARMPVFSTLNIAMWRELLSGYPDQIICEFLEFGWPIGYMSDTLSIFDLQTHRGALDFSDQVNAYLPKYSNSAELPGLLTLRCSRRDSWSPVSIPWKNEIQRRGGLSLI